MLTEKEKKTCRILLSGYKKKMSALEMMRKATENKIGKFSKQDIRELCPSLSISFIEGSLKSRFATRS
jgi:hypothetical protein